MQALFNFLLVLGDASRVSGTNEIEEEASLNSPKQIMHSTSILEHKLTFLETYGKWAYIHVFSITQSKFKPLLILRFHKVVHASGISTTHTKWDNQCSFLEALTFNQLFLKINRFIL